MVHDLEAAGKEISEGEQVLNVIWAIPNELEHWGNVKLVLAHIDYLKTFVEIHSRFEMEKEHLKMFGTPNMTLVAKGNRRKGNKNRQGR